MAVLKPRALRPGDRLAIVAPASGFSRDGFDRGVAELTRLGFVPVFEESVFERHGYMAGDPATRARAIRSALADPAIAGIVAARGGYGSVHVLPLLDVDEVRSARKVFVGYSDLTSVLTFLTSACGLVAFHGPMVAGQLGRGESGYDRRSFLAALTRVEPAGEYAAASLETIEPGEAAGPLVGGTLSQIAASFGTPYAFDPPAGSVLFLDEVNERPYRLDRMLTQLRLSGVLAKAAAVVFGELPSCDEPDGGPTARATVTGLLSGFGGPVLYGLPSGHTTAPALTLPLGVTTRVIGGRQPRVIVEEAAVDGE